MIDVVPGVAHALSLPGPHTFFLPTDKACTAHLSPETLQALRERIAFLEEQQHQRVEGTRAQIEAAGVASLRGGSAAAIAARVAKTTEQLRTFVLGHVVPGEWRMKTLLLACGAGDPRTNGNLRYQDTERQLFAPVMYASRLNSSGSGEGKKVGRGQGGKDSVNGEAGESERAQDNDEERCSVFSLPPPLSTEDPLPVWIQTSRYAAFLPITTSTNFPSALRPKASTESPSSEETASEDSVAYRQKSSSSVGGAVHLWVGGALVIKADLRAHNGVVHMIDRPLVPAQLLASPK
ncbi:conserved hypothetical protein [Neospora caninum Liverpool]|nr:conserved hypothetical protein [Neospora caninum Liverpool]CBZ51696.1 conserved hypothetical protein [Neospora caninum Liverpool]|eukprot:XP_003881729.1 conserved hypothetical protein [Neospora caninum Liverpool]